MIQYDQCADMTMVVWAKTTAVMVILGASSHYLDTDDRPSS